MAFNLSSLIATNTTNFYSNNLPPGIVFVSGTNGYIMTISADHMLPLVASIVLVATTIISCLSCCLVHALKSTPKIVVEPRRIVDTRK